MADRYLLESGEPDGYLKEDGSGVLLLEVSGLNGYNPPIYPSQIAAKPGLVPAIQAGSFFGPTTIYLLASTGVGTQGQVFAGRQVQYQAIASPFTATIPAAATLTYWTPSYPDRLDRKPTPDRSVVVEPPKIYIQLQISWSFPDGLPAPQRIATAQQQALAFSPKPELTSPHGWSTTYPDAIDRKIYSAATQLAFTTSPQPEQTLALAGRAFYPDAIDRKVYGVANQLAFTTSPQPEVKIARAWAPVYPDAIDRLRYTTANQLPFVTSPQPEHTIARAWGPIYPDWIDRKLYLAANQLAATPAAKPEAPLPRPWAIYPDAIDRKIYPAANQLAYVGSTASAFPIPDHSWQGTYPDKIDPKLGLLPALQRSLAFDPFPITSTPDTFGWRGWYPDRLDPQTFRTALQQVFAANVQPEVTIAKAWSAVYPDAIDRRLYPTAQQLPWVSSPKPETTLTGWSAVYPDSVIRGVVRVADQLAFTTSSAPEQKLPSPWNVVFPSQIARTTLPTAAIPTLALEPFPRAGAVTLSAWAIYPDRIDRNVVHSARLPFHSYGTWVPIPNPVIAFTGDEKIHLGTKESMGVTPTPTLGGWQAW